MLLPLSKWQRDSFLPFAKQSVKVKLMLCKSLRSAAKNATLLHFLYALVRIPLMDSKKICEYRRGIRLMIYQVCDLDKKCYCHLVNGRGIRSCLLQSNPQKSNLCFAKVFGQPLKTQHCCVFFTLSFESL